MKRYDPTVTPDPEEWLALDEQERIELVEEYHRTARIKLPNTTAHACFHAIVENQIAEGLEPAVTTMQRLMREGLSRHDALHAVGSATAEYVFALLHGNADDSADTAQKRYNAALGRLNAKQWRRGR